MTAETVIGNASAMALYKLEDSLTNTTIEMHPDDRGVYNRSYEGEGRKGSDPFIPLYIYITVSVFNAIIFIVGIFGNFMVVLVIIKVRDMRTPTNFFLLNLSIADILVLLICQPAGMMEFFAKDRWFIGGIMCKVVPLMENGVLHVSILTMLAVTAERYNALCHPFKRGMACTVSTTVKTIIVIWIVAYILTIPFLIMTDIQNARFYDGSPIQVCRTRIDETWRYCYAVFVFVIFFILPFFVLVFMYAMIIKQLVSDTLKTISRNDQSTVYTLRSRKQVVRMLIFIILLFFMSLFPIRVVSLWLIFTPSVQVSKIGLEAYLNIISWARIFMYINSAGNPVIYSLTSTKFKIAFNRVLRRYDPCARGSFTYSTRSSQARFKRNGFFSSIRRQFTDERQSPNNAVDVKSDKVADEEEPCVIVKLMFYTENCSNDKVKCSGNVKYHVCPLQIICKDMNAVKENEAHD